MRRQTIGSRSGARCADGLHSPNGVTRSQLTPYPLTIDHGVCSSVSPHHRSCFGRPKSFVSSNEHSHHQIDQIHISGSRIGPRNPSAASQALISFLLFCHSSLSIEDGIWKASCGTPHLQPSVSPDPQWNSSLRLRPYMVRRSLHVLPLRCLTGAGEHLSHKTGDFVCWERLGETRSSPYIAFNYYSIFVECGRIPPRSGV